MEATAVLPRYLQLRLLLLLLLLVLLRAGPVWPDSKVLEPQLGGDRREGALWLRVLAQEGAFSRVGTRERQIRVGT